MADSASAGGPQPRLDPFVLPSDTDFRFALLLLAVLGASMFAYQLVWNNRGDNFDRYLAAAEACRVRLGGSFAEGLRLAAAGTAPECRELKAVNREIVGYSLRGTALVFALAGAGFWLLPGWRLRRGGLRPIAREEVGEIADFLDGLAERAGVRRPPTFVWNPLSLGGTPLAFGRPGRRCVFVPAGLVGEYYGDREMLRVVVLHELAHLRNRDVDRTFLSIALWPAFLAGAALPYLASALGRLERSDILSLGWRVAALAALVLLVRNGVLRAREIYADVRVSSWVPGSEALARALPPEPAADARWTARLRRLLDPHPPAATRRQALRDTRLLFTLGPWDAAAAGAVTALVVPHLVQAIDMALDFELVVVEFLLAALIVSPVIVAVLGIAVWRAVLARRLLGTAPPAISRAAAGFAAGMAAGAVVSLTSWAPLSDGGPRVVIALAAWALLVGFTLRLLLHWIATGAGAWLEVAGRTGSPRTWALSGLTLSVPVAVAWLALALAGHPLEGVHAWLVAPGLAGALAGPLISPAAMWITLPPPLLLLIFSALWAYPLLPRLLRVPARAAQPWRWAFLGGHPPPGPGPPQASLRPALRAAAGTALGFAVLLVAVRVWFRVGIDWPQPREALTLALGSMLGAAVLQAWVARRVSGRATTDRAATGLLAAFLAGCLMIAVFHLVNVALFQGSATPSFVWDTVRMAMGAGLLLTLPALLHRGAGPPTARRSEEAGAGQAEAGRAVEVETMQRGGG